MKKYAIAAATAASLIVPAAASAGFMQELDAGDQVRAGGGARYHVDLTASCRTIAPCSNVFRLPALKKLIVAGRPRQRGRSAPTCAACPFRAEHGSS